MSKKHRNQFNQTTNSPAAGGAMAGELTAEYRIIKHDLLRVLVMNLIFLAAVLVVYYTNLHSGYLERFFEKVLHF